MNEKLISEIRNSMTIHLRACGAPDAKHLVDLIEFLIEAKIAETIDQISDKMQAATAAAGYDITTQEGPQEPRPGQ